MRTLNYLIIFLIISLSSLSYAGPMSSGPVSDGGGGGTGDVTDGDKGGVTVTGLGTIWTVDNDSHAHTSATISGIDISADTNLAGDTEVVLTGDSLSLAAGITRDTEWDTLAEFNAATTDDDALSETTAASTYQPLDADLTAYSSGYDTRFANPLSAAPTGANLVQGRIYVANGLDWDPVSSQKTTGALTGKIAFVEGGASADTITDSDSGFVTAGFAAHMRIKVSGSTSNDGYYTIDTVIAGTITLVTTDDLVGEVAAAQVITILGNHRYEVVYDQDAYKVKTNENGEAFFASLDLGGGAAVLPFAESADAALTTAGAVKIRGDEDRISYHAGAGGEIAGEVTKSFLEFGSWATDPGAAYDSDAEYFLFRVEADVYPNGIIIDEWNCDCNVADPDVEINADLRYADDWGTLANAADIDEIDTTTGSSAEDTDASINGDGSAIAAGKVIYIGFDGDPEGTCTQMIFDMVWHAEED